MTIALSIIAAMALAYLIGAIPFGYVAARTQGIDIREHGSGNIGATNVMRVLGKRIGLPVFALDTLKGLLPVLLTGWWCQRDPLFLRTANATHLAEVLSGLSAVLGHNFTFWLGFKGGKGVATSAGVMLGLAPVVLLAAVVVWGLSFLVLRYVSLASILAGLTLPLATLLQSHLRQNLNWPLLCLTVFIGALTLWRHRTNLERLRTGTEPRAAGRGARR